MRKIFMFLAATLLISGIALAKDEKKNLKQPVLAPIQLQVPASVATPQEKEALVANINNMRNQELRVAVLGQILNEEVAKMRDVQASFCSKYKLNVEKFRQGLYRYDDKQGKFVEAEAPKPQQLP